MLLENSGLRDAKGRASKIRLLDYGCGPALLIDYLEANDLMGNVEYTGLDSSPLMLDHARRRWPNYRFILADNELNLSADTFDFVIICGVFTVKFFDTYEIYLDLVQTTLEKIWGCCESRFSFNVMSKHVDWERDDLFHLALHDMMSFCKSKLSRHISVRADYGLWEFSVTVRKTPLQTEAITPPRWLRHK